MIHRRNFLQHTSLLSLSPLVPGFLSKTASATEARKDDRMLVVIELAGGNDGLNTVIPFADENYARYRNKLRIDTNKIIKLNDQLGLHPAMKAAAQLFDERQLAIIPGVGYPNPSRSHFRSRDIWHSGRLNAGDRTGRGWLGLAADRLRQDGNTVADAVYVGEDSMPTAIIGRRCNAIALSGEQDLLLAPGLESPTRDSSSDDTTAFIQRAVHSSYDAARSFAQSRSIDASRGDGYPDNRLARKLRLLSRFIRLDGGTRIFYVSQPGYDTHFSQPVTHDQLLTEFSLSLKAFLDDMQSSGLGDRVAVLVFSEFGRRVMENSSYGTDHGTSGPVFVAGESVNAGILGAYPSLGDLEDDDLKTTVDFRSIYSSLLTDWLRIDATDPLGGKFEPLKVIS